MATVLTNGGRAVVTARLGGSGTAPVYIGWGTGAGTASAGATGLYTEKADDISATAGTRITGTGAQYSTNVASDTYQVTGTYTATGAGTITNAGTFDAATITAGNLFMYGDFTGVGLSSGDAIAFTCRVVFA
jgi:hypothetical protein